MIDKARVYIVEDDEIIEMDLRLCLEELGYHIVGSSNSGEDAIQEILRIKPDFVLMDINLSGKMDGIEAALKIAETQSIPLAFLTGNTDEETLQRAKLALPYGYLIKPYDPSELRATIELTLFRAAQQKSDLQHESIIDSENDFQLTEDNNSSKMDLLSKIELFKDIPEADLAIFAKGMNLCSIDAGTFILSEQENMTSGFIVLSGRISITKASIAGKELIVSSLASGDIFGLFFLLKDFNGSCGARAQIDSRIISISKSSFETLKADFPQFANALTDAMAKRLQIAYELASGLAHSQVEDRIVTTILTLLPRLGHPTVLTPTSIKTGKNSRLFITRKELADLTGTTPETAIRITKNLERKGYLDLSRPGIINVVNPQGLQSMISN